MRKKTLIGLVIVLILGIIIGLTVKNNFENKKLNDQEKFSKEYPMVREINVFEYKSIKEIINIIKKESGVIFFGTPSDEWSQVYASYLNSTAEEALLKSIYYIDITNDKKDNTKEYQELLKVLNQDTINMPISVYITDGKIIYKENSLTKTKDMEAAEYFTEENTKELKEKLAVYMLDVVAYINSCEEECND